ncbi:BnaC08g11540D [Brassica napus]|uniref:BnaC08g11540D protein n=1 Tax=Brassica napus TaxID=3708 RepID=A0A078F7B2_BRANA|nr:BnaC08g11540D [Brassica napus]
MNVTTISNIYLNINKICDPPTFKLKYYDLRHKNARGMRKAILLTKRTSSLPQGLHAPRGSHGLHPTRTAKKNKCSTSKSEGNPIVECTKCGALMWTSESTGKDFKTVYNSGRPPKYLQLYIFDTGNEVKNCLKAMGQTSTEGNLDEATLARLIEMIDENNCLAKLSDGRATTTKAAGKNSVLGCSQIKGKGKNTIFRVRVSRYVTITLYT